MRFFPPIKIYKIRDPLMLVRIRIQLYQGPRLSNCAHRLCTFEIRHFRWHPWLWCHPCPFRGIFSFWHVARIAYGMSEHPRHRPRCPRAPPVWSRSASGPHHHHPARDREYHSGQPFDSPANTSIPCHGRRIGDGKSYSMGSVLQRGGCTAGCGRVKSRKDRNRHGRGICERCIG